MEISVQYYRAYGLNIASEVPLPHLAETQSGKPDLFISRGNIPPSPPLEPTKVYRAGLNARFAQDAEGKCWLVWPPLLSFLMVNENQLVLEADEVDADTLSLFTLSEALGLILFQKGYFLLHGSAIQINQKGVLFLGQPGAGKSTTVAAFSQKGVKVVCDDLVCIRINSSGRPSLIPAFPQIKIWESAVEGLGIEKKDLASVREGVNKFAWTEADSFDEHEVPLEQIFVLEPPLESGNPMHPVAKSQVPIELLNHFPLPDGLLNGTALKDYFEKSIEVANAISVVRMNRPANFQTLYDFVEYLKTTL
ncbi:serine kinase [Spirosoma sp. SC4-14]|uniref:serine kinase n=1 Tax=Spirosoma sp. SC4-14 TaxID=3128900 RepID=UPI0030CF9D70